MSAQIVPAPEHVCYVHCNFCNTILAVSVPSNSMLNIVTVRCGHCTSLLSVNLRGLVQALPAEDHLQDNLKMHNMSFRENYSEYGSSSRYGRVPMMFSKNDTEHMLHVRQSPAAAARVRHRPHVVVVVAPSPLSSSSLWSRCRRSRPPSLLSVASTARIRPVTRRAVSASSRRAARSRPPPPPEKRQRVPSAYNRFIKEEIRRIKANNPDISHREAFSTAAKNWAHFPNIHFGLGSHESSKKLDEAIGAPSPQKVQRLY
uniref:Uncharacterized protein n=1 Tax=Oryza nivara TaxID=4536 RepID=A0A0E0GR30_ORYNI